jgi:hypothetical protein
MAEGTFQDGMKLGFDTGDRVRLSAAGKKGARIADRRGMVLRKAKLSSTQFWVQWDGLKTPQLMHHTLLEKIEADPANPPMHRPEPPL